MPLLLVWAMQAVSLMNISLFVWLGLTVLINSRRRDWGIITITTALMTAAVYFIYHSIKFSAGISRPNPFFFGSWPLVWVIGFMLPFAWYIVMLWYAGFWENPTAMRNYLLHKICVIFLSSIIGLGLYIYILTPLPILSSYPIHYILSGPMVGTVPFLALIYVAGVIISIVMSLLALRCPVPTSQWMDTAARKRALPWLVTASLLLLVASITVTSAILWVASVKFEDYYTNLTNSVLDTAVWVDLGISLLITLAVLCLGQAIVAYEIFTGKVLPHGGLRRNWRRAIFLSFGLGIGAAYVDVTGMPAIYAAIMAALIIATFFALHNWRTIRERENYINHLRPFVTGPRTYDALLDSSTTDFDAVTQFNTLCNWILGARVAYLEAIGPYAALVGKLSYPDNEYPQLLPIAEIIPLCSQEKLFIAVDSGRFAGACWAVPLYGSNGLIGLFMLGEKNDGGLFTQEEMEIARAGGERLIDTTAAIHLAKRLMTLQRARLSESQVIDHRVRRTLHDEILPRLHAAMLSLSAYPQNADGLQQLTDLHRNISDMLREMPGETAAAVATHGLIEALRRTACIEFSGSFDKVKWQVDPDAEETAAKLPATQAEVIYCAAREVIRNASKYGRGNDPQRNLNLQIIISKSDAMIISIADDGVGIDSDAAPAGTGQGILLHSTMMAVIGGSWTQETAQGKYTRVILRVKN